jgi:L-fucose isomerase-like protein
MFNMRFETFDSADFQKMLVEGLANPPEWFGEVLDWIKSKIDYSEVEKDFPDTASLTALALGYVLEILVAKESNAVSINCWASIQENLRFMVCGVNALLFELGIMAPCETDWGGALANAVLQGVALGMENPVGCFMDLTRFDEETGKSLFWHCGEGAPCLVCGECKAKQGWIIPTTRGCAGLLNGKVGNVGDKVTFLQLRSGINGYPRFIAFNGAIVDGDDTIGTHFYVQVSDPEAFEGWMAQVLPLQHHSIMLGANLLPAICKISEWTGIVLDEYDELTKRVTKCVL